MRTLFKRTALLAASLMIFAVPVLADEGMYNPVAESEPGQQGGKDQCLLVASNCAGRVYLSTEKIDSIQNEINKGTRVYSNEELRVLQRRLDEEKRFFDEVHQGG